MALELLHELKKKKNEPKEHIHKNHLILGLNPYTVRTYFHLRDKFGGENVAILATSEFSPDDLELFGPNSIRGQENLAAIGKLDQNFDLVDTESIFYKELKFRPFSSKAKSEPFLEGEEYFVNKKGACSEKDFFTFSEEQIEILKKEVSFALVKSLDKTDPTDLVEAAEWTIETSSNDYYTCEYLYSGINPNAFYKLIEHKERFSADFAQYCEHTSGKSALFVRLRYEQQVSERFETLFLPLSYTHEWGHFIGEFEDSIENEGKQTAEFVTYVDEKDSNEEEISRKIRYLKKNLKKIFYPQSIIEPEIFIKFVENYTCQKLDDKLFYKEKGVQNKLFFLGIHAPIQDKLYTDSTFEDSCFSSSSHGVRALLSAVQIENFHRKTL